MKTVIIAFVPAFILLWGDLTDDAFAAGGTPKKAEQPSLHQQAIEHYNKGLKHRDKAWQHESQAATEKKEKNRKKRLEMAAREYEKAVAQQLSAIDKNPRFHEAFSSLGYAHRKLGRYEQALKAYESCLKLAPDYAEAIEYRGEAYLGLNRVAEAQQAYRDLVLGDPSHAAKLLTAFKEWLKSRRTTPVDSIDPKTLSGVESWIAEKEAIAPGAGEAASDHRW